VKVLFSEQAWEEYLFWQSSQKWQVKRINELIKNIQRSPLGGIGRLRKSFSVNFLVCNVLSGFEYYLKTIKVVLRCKISVFRATC
jgi:hypothetical protein